VPVVWSISWARLAMFFFPPWFSFRPLHPTKTDGPALFFPKDPNLSDADREAELKKARIALMRNMRSPVTPHTSMEDFSKERDQAKAMKVSQVPVFDADAVNSKLAALSHDDE
jgi:hypothetical protein